MSVRLLWFAALVAALSTWAGCRGSSERCAPESWAGQCQLRSLLKVRERAVPVPAVTYEAIYTPVPGSGPSRSLPSDIALQYDALARHELPLRDHLVQFQRVPCHVQEPAPGECTPGPLVVQVPAFDASRVASSSAPTGPRGCARIEAGHEDLPEIGAQSGAIPEHLRFEKDSAALLPESQALADAIAARIAQNAAFECVAVVGQIAVDESPSLAAERARVVRDHLVSRGVDSARLTIGTVTQKVYGSGSRPGEVDPALRRVILRVELYDTSAAGR